MLNTEKKHQIRKHAKKVFKIPRSTWINVFQKGENEYVISYLLNHIEREEILHFV